MGPHPIIVAPFQGALRWSHGRDPDSGRERELPQFPAWGGCIRDISLYIKTFGNFQKAKGNLEE